jgi:hypothetical protein
LVDIDRRSVAPDVRPFGRCRPPRCPYGLRIIRSGGLLKPSFYKSSILVITNDFRPQVRRQVSGVDLTGRTGDFGTHCVWVAGVLI